ncbi:MAG: hypothetical protein ACPGSC_03400 [Granulosicoccaceae bacterium]
MSGDVLEHRGVVAVCFACGVEKARVFSRCDACGQQPSSDDEMLDALLLSRYASTEILLSSAIAERSPAVVIKSADRTTMRTAAKVLRDPQLRVLVGLDPIEKSSPATLAEAPAEQILERLVRAAQQESADEPLQLSACVVGHSSLSVWAQNEQLLQAMHNEAGQASVDLLLEALVEIAERCKSLGGQSWRDHLSVIALSLDRSRGVEQRDIERAYERSLTDRLVVALERVRTEDLIELFSRLETVTARRRDKQPLPIHKALLDVYKHHAVKTLRKEGDNAKRLISAIHTGASDDDALCQSLVDELERLIARWCAVARPLGGVIADRDMASVRRELQGELQDVADHLAKQGENDLSGRASRLALDLL